MTRLLLVVITAVMTGSLWAAHDTSGIWLALLSFVQAIVIWLLSLKRGMGGRDRLDMVCLLLCFIGIGLWQWSNQPLIGLIASIAADIMAALPSLRKTVRLPHTELALFYALDVIAALAIMFAGPLTPMTMLFPAYIASINATYVLVIRWPRAAQKPATAVQLDQL